MQHNKSESCFKKTEDNTVHSEVINSKKCVQNIENLNSKNITKAFPFEEMQCATPNNFSFSRNCRIHEVDELSKMHISNTTRPLENSNSISYENLSVGCAQEIKHYDMTASESFDDVLVPETYISFKGINSDTKNVLSSEILKENNLQKNQENMYNKYDLVEDLSRICTIKEHFGAEESDKEIDQYLGHTNTKEISENPKKKEALSLKFNKIKIDGLKYKNTFRNNELKENKNLKFNEIDSLNYKNGDYKEYTNFKGKKKETQITSGKILFKNNCSEKIQGNDVVSENALSGIQSRVNLFQRVFNKKSLICLQNKFDRIVEKNKNNIVKFMTKKFEFLGQRIGLNNDTKEFMDFPSIQKRISIFNKKHTDF